MEVCNTAAPCAIETKGLTKLYKKRTAVNSLNLSIKQGELFSLLGQNGAGKTTTIKMLCCLLSPTSGDAKIMGRSILENAAEIKQIINVSPQETAIAPNLTAKENLELVAEIYGSTRDKAKEKANEMLSLFKISDRSNDKAKTFSGGLQRRLSIAMALITDPEILFLDEPTLGLDPQARHELWNQIKQLKGRKTIVLTTHYLEEADELADRIGILKNGDLVACGTSSELKENLSRGKTVIIKCAGINGINSDAIDELRLDYPNINVIDCNIEVSSATINYYGIIDCLHRHNIEAENITTKESSLEDVYLTLNKDKEAK